MGKIILQFHPTSMTSKDKEYIYELSNFIADELAPIIATLSPNDKQLKAVLNLIETRIIERYA